MQKVTPWLLFNGTAEEAAKFYVSLLPDSRIDHLTRAPADSPSGPAGMVIVVEFTLGGTKFFGLNGGSKCMFTEGFSFQVACDDQAEVDRLWNALTSNGGSENVCGWLKDRYGMSWQITPRRLSELMQNPDRERAKRTMQAMMKMKKIDIAELERAAE